MNLDFSPAQDALRQTARAYLAEACAPAAVREIEEDIARGGPGYNPALWAECARRGWLGLTFPAELGGQGGGLLDQVVVMEELGRVACLSPYLATVVLGGGLLLTAGTPEQQRRWLPAVARGEALLTLALSEPDAPYALDGLATTARRDDSGYRLDGRKLPVPYAHVANALLVVARGAAGPAAFLVEAGASGLELTRLSTMALDAQHAVALTGTPAEPLADPATGREAIESVRLKAGVALAALMMGGAERVVELSVEYAKNRVAFGAPIGSYQAVSHKLAEMATDVAAAHTLVHQAAWAIDHGEPWRRLAAMARAYAGDIYRRVTVDGIQVHGGIGFTLDKELELYYRQAKAYQLTLADAPWCEAVVAEEVLGGVV